MLGIVQKQPNDKLDYDIGMDDWLAWCGDGDTLSSATATQSGSTATIAAIQISGNVVKVWVDGGATGETAKITVIATSTIGRIKEVDFKIRIRDC